MIFSITFLSVIIALGLDKSMKSKFEINKIIAKVSNSLFKLFDIILQI